MKLKVAWVVAEQLGRVVGGQTSAASSTVEGAAPSSRDEAIASIRADYDQAYFVSGKGEMAGYADDCEFSDPFVSFKGVDRFKQNVGNLGAALDDVMIDIYEWEEEEWQITAKWRFSSIVQALPWKPRVAARGRTTHVVDPESNLVVKHLEVWDVAVGDVLKQVLRPASKLPQNEWETGMLSLSEGDLKGAWSSAAPAVLTVAGPLAGLSLLSHALGLPLGGVEPFAVTLSIVCVVTLGARFFDSTFGS